MLGINPVFESIFFLNPRLRNKEKQMHGYFLEIKANINTFFQSWMVIIRAGKKSRGKGRFRFLKKPEK